MLRGGSMTDSNFRMAPVFSGQSYGRVRRQRCFNFRHSKKRQPRKQPRGASLTWADVRRSSGIKPRAAGIAGGSADRRLRRVRGIANGEVRVRLFTQAATLRSPRALHYVRNTIDGIDNVTRE